MSKKLWFIFEDNHHIGPFDRQQMVEKIARGELLEDDLIWSEGEPHWVEAIEHQSFASYFLPPPLPPLPEVDVPVLSEDPVEDIELPPVPETDPFEEELLDDLPPLPVEDREEFEDDQTQKDIPFPESPRGGPSLTLKISVAVAFVLMTVFSWFLFHVSGEKKPAFHELRPADMAELESFIAEPMDQPSDRDELFKLALSRDARSVIMASPLVGRWQAYIVMHSLPGEILSERASVLEGKAVLENHRAHFREFKIREGLGFAPGHYRVRIQVVDPKAPEKTILEREFEQNFTRMTAEEFAAEKAKLAARLQDLAQRHRRQRYETYQTLGQLIERTFALYEQTLTRIREREQISQFEASYGAEVGPLLQGLVLDAHQQMKLLSEAGEEEEARSYELLVEFGRSVGSMVSDMVTLTQRSRRFNQASRERLLRLFQGRKEGLLQDLQLRVDQLSSALESEAE